MSAFVGSSASAKPFYQWAIPSIGYTTRESMFTMCISHDLVHRLDCTTYISSLKDAEREGAKVATKSCFVNLKVCLTVKPVRFTSSLFELSYEPLSFDELLALS